MTATAKATASKLKSVGRKPASHSTSKPTGEPTPSKLDLILELTGREQGASLAELSTATNWQVHSVRGAMAGSLKKKGHVITSEMVDGVRRYKRAAS